ncbi:MAG: ChaN family lipoprotein, partial [Candidatus Wallbacteria bacterium]|nr:ChaN family lipoprotein [Candidatus Wallbacteria bacterium]
MKILSVILFLYLLCFHTRAGEELEKIVTVFRASDGSILSFQELMLELNSNYDVVFVGELHDDLITHKCELEMLSGLYKLDPSWNISMEMFERDVQHTLDQYLTGAIDEASFLASARPWPEYQSSYRPLVEFARTAGISVLAANVPRKYASLVVKQGWDALNVLPPDERVLVCRELFALEDDYFRRFLDTMARNMGKETTMQMMETYRSMYLGQCIKDDTMAESMNGFLLNHPRSKLIHFNGRFHSDYRLGTVQRLLLRNDSLEVAVVSIVPQEKEHNRVLKQEDMPLADFVIYCERISSDDPLQKRTMLKSENVVHISEHYLDIELLPEDNMIRAFDRISFDQPTTRPFTFRLFRQALIDAVTVSGVTQEISTAREDNFLRVTIKPDKKQVLRGFEVRYSGQIYQPLTGRRLDQAHDFTPGMISTAEGEGVFLPAGCGWYPCADDDLSRFTVRITAPPTLILVSQGELIKRETADNRGITVWQATQPSEGCALVGGDYQVRTLVHGDVSLSAYLFEEHFSFSDEIIKLLMKYLDAYQELFGPLPFKRFDVVESFFSAGYGMPGFTLLAPELFSPRMSFVISDPGTLAHELLHSWWGHSVMVDETGGNWCEGLTSYCSNYYWKVFNEGPKAAVEWRKKTIVDYNMLPEDSIYPLIDFKTNSSEIDALVGYGRGAMFYHMLRHYLGEERFFSGLRNVIKNFSGKRISWPQLRTVLLDNPGEENEFISGLFEQALTYRGIPDLRLENIQRTDECVAFDLVQTGEIYALKLPLRIVTQDKTENRTLFIDGPKKHFYFKYECPVKSVEIDPDYHILRKLSPSEYPLCL